MTSPQLDEGVPVTKQWSGFNENGDLPPGIHQATLAEVVAHFGQTTPERQIMIRREVVKND